jgi:hypothetical protein
MLKQNTEINPSIYERNHAIVNSPVALKDGSLVTAAALAERFYNHPYGVAMRQQPLRFTGGYAYAQDTMLNDLGHDVDPIGHQVELAYHAGLLIEREESEQTLYGSLSEEDKGMLAFVCLIHDIGESTHEDLVTSGLVPVGDIQAGKKTDADRHNESKIRHYFYDTFFNDVDEAVIQRVEAIISHSDITHLHDLFEASHHVQTIETSLYAYLRLADSVWQKNGDVFPISSNDGQRQSALLGILRVVGMHALIDAAPYVHLSYVQDISKKLTSLLKPSHQLFDSI